MSADRHLQPAQFGTRPTSDEMLVHLNMPVDEGGHGIEASLARKAKHSAFLEKEHDRMHKEQS